MGLLSLPLVENVGNIFNSFSLLRQIIPKDRMYNIPTGEGLVIVVQQGKEKKGKSQHEPQVGPNLQSCSALLVGWLVLCNFFFFLCNQNNNKAEL